MKELFGAVWRLARDDSVVDETLALPETTTIAREFFATLEARQRAHIATRKAELQAADADEARRDCIYNAYYVDAQRSLQAVWKHCDTSYKGHHMYSAHHALLGHFISHCRFCEMPEETIRRESMVKIVAVQAIERAVEAGELSRDDVPRSLWSGSGGKWRGQ